eukprot:284817090_6
MSSADRPPLPPPLVVIPRLQLAWCLICVPSFIVIFNSTEICCCCCSRRLSNFVGRTSKIEIAGVDWQEGLSRFSRELFRQSRKVFRSIVFVPRAVNKTNTKNLILNCVLPSPTRISANCATLHARRREEITQFVSGIFSTHCVVRGSRCRKIKYEKNGTYMLPLPRQLSTACEKTRRFHKTLDMSQGLEISHKMFESWSPPQVDLKCWNHKLTIETCLDTAAVRPSRRQLRQAQKTRRKEKKKRNDTSVPYVLLQLYGNEPGISGFAYPVWKALRTRCERKKVTNVFTAFNTKECYLQYMHITYVRLLTHYLPKPAAFCSPFAAFSYGRPSTFVRAALTREKAKPSVKPILYSGPIHLILIPKSAHKWAQWLSLPSLRFTPRRSGPSAAAAGSLGKASGGVSITLMWKTSHRETSRRPSSIVSLPMQRLQEMNDFSVSTLPAVPVLSRKVAKDVKRLEKGEASVSEYQRKGLARASRALKIRTSAEDRARAVCKLPILSCIFVPVCIITTQMLFCLLRRTPPLPSEMFGESAAALGMGRRAPRSFLLSGRVLKAQGGIWYPMLSRCRDSLTRLQKTIRCVTVIKCPSFLYFVLPLLSAFMMERFMDKQVKIVFFALVFSAAATEIEKLRKDAEISRHVAPMSSALVNRICFFRISLEQCQLYTFWGDIFKLCCKCCRVTGRCRRRGARLGFVANTAAICMSCTMSLPPQAYIRLTQLKNDLAPDADLASSLTEFIELLLNSGDAEQSSQLCFRMLPAPLHNNALLYLYHILLRRNSKRGTKCLLRRRRMSQGAEKENENREIQPPSGASERGNFLQSV